ncbi:MAG: hypothetical protein RM368_28030 [Nostoc sp. DedSLP03]|uniref:hypothetical protein n=1 Tax=Nostoc sp. DedSLP03 TaxID=3075400 RepID=UPI002AD3C1C4|nr:hypothetical protein [Nostoc sp. DedSLP03]MDZ7968757.1 hypothetical protein [Nostoc sp. DedSLP03]
MSQLSIVQLLYLLYAQAYSNGDTVTKSVVKSYLSKELQKEAEQSYEALIEQKLIESPRKNRLSLTSLGKKILVSNLQNTKYRFDSVKGPKVINILLEYLQQVSHDYHNSSSQSEDMDFDTYVEKFKALYFEERKRQELLGVVAIYSRVIRQKVYENNQISQSLLDKYFEKLKSTGKVFAVTEKDEELIQWAE